VRSRKMTFRLWAASLIELLMLLPLWLAADAFFMPERLRVTWLLFLPVLSLIGVIAGFRVRVLWRQLALSAVIGAACAYAVSGEASVSAATVIVFGSAAWLGSTVRSRHSEPAWYWGGLILYFIAALLYPHMDRFAGNVAWLTIAGIVCLAFALFASNKQFLRDAALANERPETVPPTLRRHNGMYIAVILIAVVAATAAFGNAAGKLLFMIVKTILQWLLMSGPKEEPTADRPLPPTDQAPGPGSEDRGLIALIIDIIGYIIGGLLMAALIAGAVYWLYKHAGGMLRVWVRRVKAWLTRSTEGEEGAGYTDEESIVFSWEAASRRMRNGWIGRIAGRRQRDRWEDQQSNQERIRYLYRHWLRAAIERGYEPSESLTPKETAMDVERWDAEANRKRTANAESDEVLLRLYYRVRYAEQGASDDEVERAKSNRLKE
jgi:hypothetical protein